MRREIEADPRKLFERWYVQPLRELEKLPDGDGGFVVLATCCFLYERYARAYLRDSGEKASDENVICQLSRDFGVPRDIAEVFWNVIRNGFLHQGMPKARDNRGRTSLPGWRTHHAFPRPIDLVSGKAPTELQIQPWLFRDRVFELYQARPDLIAYDKNFLWGAIVKLVEEGGGSR
ncbi:hypothetical protein D4R47_02630 [archaeon]|nr:MAG: hypothetical protein D4R47_02630 [archaeon]